ncbi:MAG: oligosaccharide flippase family protein [Flavobacteriales bacterium]|jgi:O-antigen/teichoic acid export membrane protein|nr:oligosaccharide flippase family protein [Flavobacteriales bacterium]
MIQKIKETIQNSSYIRNALTLSIGTVISQLVLLIFSPILLRVFSPEQFGFYNSFLGIANILGVIYSFKYEYAFFVEKEEEKRQDIFKLSFILSAFSFLITFILIIVFGDWFAESYGYSKGILFLVPFGGIILAYESIFRLYLNYYQHYKAISMARFFRAISFVLFSFIIGYLTDWLFGLALAEIIGFSALIIWASKYVKLSNFKVNPYSLKAVASRYIDFPKFQAFAGVVEKLSVFAPVFFLTAYYSLDISGQFSAAFKIIAAPIGVITVAFGDVYREKASKMLLETGSCRDLLVQTSKKLLLFSIIPILILFFFSPFIFSFFFGKEWVIAGEMVQLLSLMFIFQIATSPISSTIIFAEKQKYDLIIQIVLCISLYTVFYFIHQNNLSYTHIVVGYISVYIIKYIFEFSLAYKFSKA